MSSSKRSQALKGKSRLTKASSLAQIHRILSEIGTARALAVSLILADEGGQDELLLLPDVDFNTIIIHGFDKLSRDYQATRMLAKADFLKLKVDRKEVALRKESEAESQCRETNKFFRSGSNELYALRESVAYRKAKRLIADVLGDFEGFISACAEGQWDPGWTPGRNTVNYGDSTSSIEKFAAQIECTASACGNMLRVIQAHSGWAQASIEASGPVSLLLRGLTVVEGNVLTVVPKNSKTDRTICYEPNGNIWLQKMVGDYIRKRLKRYGCDLSDQTINSSLAKEGSKYGLLSTLDLSAASDTLAKETVFELLPLDWASFLDKIRSRKTYTPSGWRMNEKFSSMGNGFTFELESLIFLALSKAVSTFVSVYGDDIIVLSSRTTAVVEILNRFGFSLNMGKSFSYGPFRESCGGDFLLGVRITPFYIRSISSGWTVKVHNQMRERLSGFALSNEYEFLKSLRIESFPYGPSGYGDGHYHVNLDEACPSRAPFEIDGWWYRSVVKTLLPKWLLVDGMYDGRLAPAAVCSTTGPRRTFNVEALPHTKNVRYRTVRALAKSWPEVIVK
jgi:hypothetical protein